MVSALWNLNGYTFFLFFPFIIIVCIIFYPLIEKSIKRYITENREREKYLVSETSLRVREIKSLASHYRVFCNIPDPLYVEHQYNSKRSFDNADLNEALIYLANHEESIKAVYTGLCQNRKNGDAFRASLSYRHAPPTPEAVIKSIHMSPRKFYKIEDQLCAETSCIKEDVSVIIELTYHSPANRNSYKRTIETGFYGLKAAYSETNKRIAQKLEAEEERKKLTDKLRYQVLQRDHHRCVICGRGAEDGVKLHIDHIKPVSKGGKTELSNLRVLCDRCNLGKGASYEPYGMN